MKGPRATRALAAVFVLALVVPVIAGCHAPKPKLNGPPIDQVYGQVLPSTSFTIIAADEMTTASRFSRSVGERCALVYYLVYDDAQAVQVGRSEYMGVDSQGYGPASKAWPFDPMPGSYRIYGNCGGPTSDDFISAIIRKRPQTVSWAPVTTITSLSASGAFTPSMAATASNGGPITYSLTGSTGAAACSLGGGAPPAVTVLGNGSCTMRADLAAIDIDDAASTSVTVTINAFATPTPTPAPEPTLIPPTESASPPAP